MNKLTIVLILILFWLQYSLWFAKNGLCDYIRTKNEILTIYKINLELKDINELLHIEVNDLYTGYDAIEEQARTELNMIKSGEHFYRIFNK